MSKHYLLSRSLDPVLGVFTGIFAYYLNETNPRSAPPPGHTLRELAQWRWNESKQARAHKETATSDDVDWEKVRKEFEEAGSDKQGKDK